MAFGSTPTGTLMFYYDGMWTPPDDDGDYPEVPEDGCVFEADYYYDEDGYAPVGRETFDVKIEFPDWISFFRQEDEYSIRAFFHDGSNDESKFYDGSGYNIISGIIEESFYTIPDTEKVVVFHIPRALEYAFQSGNIYLHVDISTPDTTGLGLNERYYADAAEYAYYDNHYYGWKTYDALQDEYYEIRIAATRCLSNGVDNDKGKYVKLDIEVDPMATQVNTGFILYEIDELTNTNIIPVAQMDAVSPEVDEELLETGRYTETAPMILKDMEFDSLEKYKFIIMGGLLSYETLQDEAGDFYQSYTLVHQFYGEHIMLRNAVAVEIPDTANGGVSIGCFSTSNDTEPKTEIALQNSFVEGMPWIGNSVYSLSNLGIQTGKVTMGITVASNGYATKEIEFEQSFTETPVVLVNYSASSSTAGRGKLKLSASNVTTDGFTLRAFNAHTGTVNPSVYWVAFGNMDSGYIPLPDQTTFVAPDKNMTSNKSQSCEASASTSFKAVTEQMNVQYNGIWYMLDTVAPWMAFTSKKIVNSKYRAWVSEDVRYDKQPWIALKTKCKMKQIVIDMDAVATPNDDYPNPRINTVDVYVSNDGKNWTKKINGMSYTNGNSIRLGNTQPYSQVKVRFNSWTGENIIVHYMELSYTLS